MERADWESRWREGRIAFHQAAVTETLKDYADLLWGEEKPGRVLVPLCGKSLDMVFLAEQGAEVVGVEYVEQAVQQFFTERDLSPSVESDSFRRYSAGRWTIFATDFFSLGSDQLGPIDSVLDRAALVAFDETDRFKYAERLRSILSPGGRILLVTLDYDQSRMEGPPFAVSQVEVRRLFSEGFAIEHLVSRDSLSQRFRELGLPEMTESAYLLTRRSAAPVDDPVC